MKTYHAKPAEASPTFWTICWECEVQYEYHREYVNKRLSCKNCAAVFRASEIGTAQVNDSYCIPSYLHENGCGGNGFEYAADCFIDLSGYLSKYAKNFKPGTLINGVVLEVNADVFLKTTQSDKKRKLEYGQTKASIEEWIHGIKPKLFGGKKELAFDSRSFLIKRMKTDILKKLEEMKMTPAEKSKPITLQVPDSDFHEFDKHRTEECFQAKQIWAVYDPEDGMPRLYCLIRQVISTKPFKVHISYLSSKSDTEFGAVNWVNSGFTKSCGNFRAFETDIVDQVNMFSHLLSKEKAGRGGFVKIFPRVGEIWAVYKNWSEEWNRTTPSKVRHAYEMVEVIEDYEEEKGVCVRHLIKLEGFKTVYCREKEKSDVWWIPRREMMRFSHQVPAWMLKDRDGWDLDPAANPQEAQFDEEDVKVEDETNT